MSEKAGVADKPGYYGLGAVFVDINNDGKPDLLVGNDSTPNYLYLNKGDGTFEDVSYASGYALNEDGRETASMGIAVGDYENNGMLDVFNTTFSDDYKPLYRNEGDANFTDISYHLGIAEITVPFLSWGDAFLDYDNDGWKDLLMSDGHVYPAGRQVRTGAQAGSSAPCCSTISRARSSNRSRRSKAPGSPLVIAGRGMAVGDLFNDGKIDAVINVMDGHPVLLRNVDPDKNHWLELKLIGGRKEPARCGRRDRVRHLQRHEAARRCDQRRQLSLHQRSRACTSAWASRPASTTIEVHWPSGRVEKFTVPGVDRIVTLTEGTGK